MNIAKFIDCNICIYTLKSMYVCICMLNIYTNTHTVMAREASWNTNTSTCVYSVPPCSARVSTRWFRDPKRSKPRFFVTTFSTFSLSREITQHVVNWQEETLYQNDCVSGKVATSCRKQISLSKISWKQVKLKSWNLMFLLWWNVMVSVQVSLVEVVPWA